MTVSSQTNKVIYIGNGVAKKFAIPFSFLEQEHIKVRQNENDIQTERTDWTVKSGNLVFADAPESGAEIAIVREVPLTQETDYRDNEILHAETSRQLNRRHGAKLARIFVRLNQSANINIGNAVTVRQHKRFVADIFPRPFDASARHGVLSRVEHCHAPRLIARFMNFNGIVFLNRP